MEQISFEEDAMYIFALGFIPGLGPQVQRRIVSHFPTIEALQNATAQDLERILRSTQVDAIFYQFIQPSSKAQSHLLHKAREVFHQHIQADIIPIPITSSIYPPLLKKIPDPPVLLYAKGNISLLQHTNAVAIVGTREPTTSGRNVARHLAHHFAEQDYCIISGLAKGIDTAAHEGALEVQGGKTIAVFGTPLNQIYPASNKILAQSILDTDGLLLSEISLGQQGFRSAFVMRDRIQSGLALAVIPVQTKVDGGAMHTVNFAWIQHRLVACPVPLKYESEARQYDGIYAILQKKQEPAPYAFKPSKIDQTDILERLQQIKHSLLDARKQHEEKVNIGREDEN